MEYKIMTREELEYMMMDLHVICLMKDAEIERLKDENEMLRDRNEYLRTKNNQAVIEQGKEKAELKDLLVDREKQIENWKKYYRILHAIKTEQVKENKQLKKQIDELTYENSELGKFNIHMYVREHEKLMKENKHLKKQIDELISIRYDLEDELSSIKYDFDNLSKEKAELLGKIESLKGQLDREIERIDELSDQCSEQLETIATLQKANNNQERIIKNQEARILMKDTRLEDLNISLKKAIDEKMAMIGEIKIYIDTIKKLEAVEKNNPPVMDDTDCDSSELPYRADTESRPKFDDSVDCRPRKQ